ncbi:MAG: hypothetical protein PHT07_09025 [Paludibacter sp.]|nr:hypothetical protein [Paludibacter sp.]
MKQKKIMNQIINTIIFFIFLNNLSYSQNILKSNDSLFIVNPISKNKTITKIDTISWSNEKIIIELPKLKYKHSSSYEEGFFQYFIIPLDSVTVTIHCGSMVKLPLTDLTKYTLTGKFILDKDIRILRGYNDSKKNEFKGKRYFREDNYFKYGITIIYENVTEEKISFYENIFNNIKILRPEKIM